VKVGLLVRLGWWGERRDHSQPALRGEERYSSTGE